MEPIMTTLFASAARAEQETLQRQLQYFIPRALSRRLLDALPGMLLVFNAQRQILYANQAVLSLVGASEESVCIGLRMGELLGCEHVAAAPGGCGTGEVCSTCGAVLATLAGLTGQTDVRECRLTHNRHERIEALDLRANASPFVHQGERFVILAVSDISHEKRRQALEQVFYHDILNLAGSVKGFTELLVSYDLGNREEIYHLMHEASEQVINEIEAQRLLQYAENGILRPRQEIVEVAPLLTSLLAIYQHHQIASGRKLVLVPLAKPLALTSDKVLLGRILGNMLKNALEASALGETVTLSCAAAAEEVEFRVHNGGTIPRAVQMQMFKRYFSTKGEHRGLGTYSMRLFSEYLGGRISFSSDELSGTTFRLCVPRLRKSEN